MAQGYRYNKDFVYLLNQTKVMFYVSVFVNMVKALTSAIRLALLTSLSLKVTFRRHEE
jgi:hypothetical protein